MRHHRWVELVRIVLELLLELVLLQQPHLGLSHLSVPRLRLRLRLHLRLRRVGLGCYRVHRMCPGFTARRLTRQPESRFGRLRRRQLLVLDRMAAPCWGYGRRGRLH